MWGIVLAAVVAIAAGCAPSPGPATAGGKIELKFWNGFTGPDGDTMDAIVKAFNKEHPDVHVDMERIAWSTYYDKVTLGLAFGGAPDVFVLHANRVPEFASHHVLARLDEGLTQAGLKESDFVPAAWKAGQWEGARYALPLDCHPLGMYYNVDLFRQAGISKPPETLDEFVEDAKRLTKDTNGDGKPDQWGFAFTWLHSNGLTFLDQFGSGLLAPDLKTTELDSQKSVDAMNLMIRFVTQDKICPPPAGTDAWLGFQSGKIAMAMEGVYMMSSLEKLKDRHFAAAPIPQFGPVKAVWAGSHCLTMPASLTGERRDAAWAFIKYLSDHSILWAKGGQVPVRRAIIDSPEFQSLSIQREFAKQLPYIQYEPFSVSFNQISSFADAAIEGSVNQSEAPLPALKTAARRVREVLRRE